MDEAEQKALTPTTPENKDDKKIEAEASEQQMQLHNLINQNLAKKQKEAQEDKAIEDNMKQNFFTHTFATVRKEALKPLVFFHTVAEKDAYNTRCAAVFCQEKLFQHDTTIAIRAVQKIIKKRPTMWNAEEERQFHRMKSKATVASLKEQDPEEPFDVDDVAMFSIDEATQQSQPKRKEGKINVDSGLDSKHSDHKGFLLVPLGASESESDKKLYAYLKSDPSVPFQPVMHLTPGAQYLLTSPYRANNIAMGVNTRLIYQYPVYIDQQPLNVEIGQPDDDKAENVDCKTWITMDNESKKNIKSRSLFARQTQLQIDICRNMEMDPERYRESEDFKRMQAKVDEIQKVLQSKKIKLPLMSAPEFNNYFVLYPLCWTLSVDQEEFVLQQFPLRLGYALTYEDLLGPKRAFGAITVTLETLEKNPALLLALVSSVSTSAKLEIVREGYLPKFLETLRKRCLILGTRKGNSWRRRRLA